MIHSKATAVLMRLKEMDRKYKIKHKEEKRTHSLVSTESSLENTPKSNNSKLVHEGNEIASKVSAESKMEMQGSGTNNVNSSDEDVHSKKSPKISPRTRTEVSLSVEIEGNIRSASRTEESLRTVSNLESDLKTNSQIRDDVLLSEDSRRHGEESSAATIFSKRSAAPETISEVVKSRNEGKSNTTNPEDDTTIDEVIRISDERSEIISELSNPIDKDEDASNVSSMDEQKLQYENDTFEEASNSSGSSSSTELQLKKSSEELAGETVISGVKEIKITSHKQAEIIQEKVINDEKDKEIIELIAPKIIKSNSECDVGLDEELSNYVRTTENVDEVLPINLLKPSKQTTTGKKHVRKSRKQRKSSNENTEEKTEDLSVVSDDHERSTKVNNNEDALLKENSSSMIVKSASNEGKIVKETLKVKKESLSNEQTPVEIEEEANREPETISSEKLLTETPKKTDATSTLRELNKDAINAIVRRHRIQTINKITDKPRYKNYKTVVKLPSAESEVPENMEKNESKSLENIRTDSSHNQRVRGRRAKVKRVSKASKARKGSYQGKVEEKQSKFECRQSRHLRKQAAALRMQQEREDIRNYLLELECTRLEFGPGEMTSATIPPFKPLEFPKISAFKKPELEDSNLPTDGIVALQEKILTIRQWLKDQYFLYRDYSKLAQTVNAKYIPASLEDAKKTIRQLQSATIESK
ncbi:uncharacterized protein LOC117608911 [Osmia lignaria lignaria]|uniref:uncharacterized protein LOC117608911 n=1 Tax=Osmia lignaria lignaria TaxID=1437193 RepID=UPI00402BBE54